MEKTIFGKKILVGLTYLNSNGEVRKQRTMANTSWTTLMLFSNPVVKGRRRTQALYNVCGLFEYAGFALARHTACPLTFTLGISSDFTYLINQYFCEDCSMRNCLYAIAFSLSVILLAKPTNACMTMEAIKLDDIKYASVVVIGRITNYEVVLDQAVRQERKKELARPNLPPEYRKALSRQKSFMSDYAHFNVLVDEVLVGAPPQVLSVTWDNSTFGEPKKLDEGPFLIALRKQDAQTPPLRGPSATILPVPEPQSLTILQAPCAPPFMLKATSAETKKVRDLLSGGAKLREEK
jgi:hypothetical protein